MYGKFSQKYPFNLLDLFFVISHFLVGSGRFDRIRNQQKGSDPAGSATQVFRIML